MTRRIVIVGGGSAGWMAAALFARLRPSSGTQITLVECDAIGTIGVGEATVPILRDLNALLGLNEPDFVRATQGSFKLGIQFVDWGVAGNRHFHGFGDFGADMAGVPPHHHWLRLRAAGRETCSIDAWSLPAQAAGAGLFAPPEALGASAAATFRYAYHFDAGLYARLLSTYALARGVTHVQGRIAGVRRDGESGNVMALTIEGGRHVDGDLFIDCSGFASLLLGEALEVPFVDWSHWLPCDRALALPSTRAGRFTPFTSSTAHSAGWQWRIPLQHRTGNGLVYSSRHLADDAAADLLLANVDGEALADPRPIRFTTGRRARFWVHNVIGIGLAAGFMEPLESTSLQLVQTGLARLAELLPHGPPEPALVDEYNRQTIGEYERIRDFLIAHYCISHRPEAFWRDVATMPLPDSLMHKLALWQASAKIALYDLESHREASWVAILLGQQCIPHGWHSGADAPGDPALTAEFARRREEISRLVSRMPDHATFVARTCQAEAA